MIKKYRVPLLKFYQLYRVYYFQSVTPEDESEFDKLQSMAIAQFLIVYDQMMDGKILLKKTVEDLAGIVQKVME